jgi:hypothetical protein
LLLCKLHHKKRDETNVMSGNEKNLEIRIEQDMGVAAAREKHVSSMPASHFSPHFPREWDCRWCKLAAGSNG